MFKWFIFFLVIVVFLVGFYGSFYGLVRDIVKGYFKAKKYVSSKKRLSK